MTEEICECGHKEWLHGFNERPCQVHGCSCEKFKAKEKKK